MKKLICITTMLAVTLTVAIPALAQTTADQYSSGLEESVTATGIIEKPEATTYMYGTHFVTDEASGTDYALKSNQVELDEYVGERTTVFGAISIEEGELEGGPALIDVTGIESAGVSEETTRRFIIGIPDGSILVSEEPGLGVDDPGYCEKTLELQLTGETDVLLQQNGELVPTTPDTLQEGQLVEATYAQPSMVPAICPSPRTAISIVILQNGSEDDGDAEDPGNDPNVLPDTGGTSLPVVGATVLMIFGGLLARRLIR